jgi:uncharacterized protein YqjF (DUF2071 family)
MMQRERTFLTAEWRYLAMLNYAADPDLLAPYVPFGTELDTWCGVTYLSVVGFLFRRTRVLGMSIPMHREFEEVNLRFYVRRRGPEGWRRGVVFIREIVPRAAVTTVARLAYGEPYVTMPMRHRLDTAPNGEGLRDGATVEYAWRCRDRWNGIRAVTTGPPEPLREGSEEEYITEHYWGYTARRDGVSSEYWVEHPPWQVWQTSEAALDCDVKAVYGSQFVEPLSAAPRSAFVADGSAIRVQVGRRLTRPRNDG